MAAPPGAVIRVAALAVALVLATPAVAGATSWGVDAYSAPHGSIAKLEADMGKPFAAWAIYQGLDGAGTFAQSSAPAIQRGALRYLNITSTRQVRGTKTPDCWTDIAAGRYDADIRAWAAAIVAAGHQDNLVLTFEHEPTARSSSQPKCRSDDASTYVPAFAHVHDLLRAGGVTAPFAYVVVAGVFQTPDVVTRWAPFGYFEMLGTDGYNRASQWKTVPEKLGPFFDWWRSNVLGDQLFLGELGVDSRHSGAAQWITDAWAYLQAQGGPALAFVNWNVKPPWGPQTRDTLAAWLRIAP